MQRTNRIIFEGYTWGGEVWSSGFALADVSNPVNNGTITDFEGLTDLADAIWTGLTGGGWPNLQSALSQSNGFSKVRVESREGTTLLQAGESASGLETGNGAGVLPPQCAAVFSLRTGRPGRSYKGRMYWPATGVSPESSTGRMGNTFATALLGDYVEMLSDVATLANGIMGPGSQLAPVVYSTKLDLVTPVTTIALGNVIDTQRRRRDKLAETYISEAYA